MIGIFFPPPALDVSKIKYSLQLIKIFDKERYRDKVIILVHKKDIKLLQGKIKFLSTKLFGLNYVSKVIYKIKKRVNIYYKASFDDAIKANGISFAVFPIPEEDISKCKIPFAASIQSLGHRLNPELRETSQGGIWKVREDECSFVCKNAKFIFIDSEQGKYYLKFYYNPKAEIIVLPHSFPDELNLTLSSDREVEILNKFDIKKKFLFYPAQFWPHKNHVRIFEAVRYLRSKGISLQVVFTGSDKTVRKQYGIEYMLKRIAKDSNMEDSLIITGYLTKEEVKALYKNALAMVMPQLIPEPCIPFVEAMRLGCPIIAPDIPGIREQVGGCAVLVNPCSVESIAGGIESLFLNKWEREALVKKGYQNYENITSLVSQSFNLIEETIFKLLDIES